MFNEDYHLTHCDHCFIAASCSHSHCAVLACPLKCGRVLHQCKLTEHLSETCCQAEVACINETNGCRATVKRCHMSTHLMRCCANVVHCSAFRMRKLVHKDNKSKHLNSRAANPHNINDILLQQDYASLRQFCRQEPLKFQRMYGHLIGLKLDPGCSEFRLSFLNLLLKTVKSRVFQDIEAENCIVFNDDLGCSACQTRIKYLEMERFNKLKKDRYHFDFVLREVFTYEEFVHRKVYESQQFVEAYEQFYLRPSREEREEKAESKFANESGEELERKLKETNGELIDAIELDAVMKLNVAKELPCDAFQMSYESYRINDSHFAVECDQLLRRDEFSHHYDFYHNFLFSNAELIDKKCPFSQYGCAYFKTSFDFMFTSEFDAAKCLDDHLLSARLGPNQLAGQLTFELTNLNDACPLDLNYSLVELPLDLLFEIFTKLDSLSLYSLSLTCKAMRRLCEMFVSVRGIVYPKWVKQDNLAMDRNNNDLKSARKWIIDKYVFSYSKHIEVPKKIKIKNNVDMVNNYNQHVQNCEFRVCKKLDHPFRLFPPYNENK